MKKSIQEHFGQSVINSFVEFCRSDIPSASTLENQKFDHIDDPDLKKYLSQTYYGARWVYKIGLGLLSEGDEAISHVRTQVIDYGSICEAVLADCILFGINSSTLGGDKYLFSDCNPKGKKMLFVGEL